MPNPLVSSVHVDAALTGMSVAYLQDQRNFVARRVFPVVNVQHRSDKYFVYNQADFLRDSVQLRAAGTESAAADYRLSTATYTAERYALHKDIADEIRFNADEAIDPERDATEFLMQKMLIHEDRKFAQDFMKTGVWDNNKNGSTADFTQFTVSSTDIVSTMDGWGDTIHRGTGKRPNTLVLSRDVYSVFKNNATILESIKYTQRGIATPELLAELFNLDQVIVCDSVYNTAAEGQTAAYDFAVGEDSSFPNSGLLCYVNPNPSILAPSAGYSFVWTPYADAAGGAVMKSFYMDQLASDRIEAEMYWDQKAVSSACALFFYNAV